MKATETRRKKIAKESVHDVYYCGVCHDQYTEYTDQEKKWTGCDGCDMWFHFECAGIEEVPEKYFCDNCKETN